MSDTWDVYLVYPGSKGKTIPIIKGVSSRLRANWYATFEHGLAFLTYEPQVRPKVIVVKSSHVQGTEQEIYSSLTREGRGTHVLSEDEAELFDDAEVVASVSFKHK